MKSYVYCSINNRNNYSFYVQHNKQTYFLFNQNYHPSIQEYFSRPFYLEDGIKYSKWDNHSGINHIIDKLSLYIKYIEKEYGVTILKNTKRKKGDFQKRTCA